MSTIENPARFRRFLGSAVSGALAGAALGWLASLAAAPYLVGVAGFLAVGGLVWRSWGRIPVAR